MEINQKVKGYRVKWVVHDEGPYLQKLKDKQVLELEAKQRGYDYLKALWVDKERQTQNSKRPLDVDSIKGLHWVEKREKLKAYHAWLEEQRAQDIKEHHAEKNAVQDYYKSLKRKN